MNTLSKKRKRIIIIVNGLVGAITGFAIVISDYYSTNQEGTMFGIIDIGLIVALFFLYMLINYCVLNWKKEQKDA